MSSNKLQFKLKWTASDPSEAIILTFPGDSIEPLLAGKISVVFRKMGPKQFTPKLIYAYVSAPTKAIVAKLCVISWEKKPFSEAIKYADLGNITHERLGDYAKEYSDLLVIRVGVPEKANKPLTLNDLSSEFDFWPSSTYMPLSANGVETLDRICDFAAN